MSTKDIDHGWNKIQKQLSLTDGAHVVVGVPETTGPREDGDPASMAEVAFWNEFGTDYIPERSFLRSTIDENQTKYFELDARLIGGVFKGKLDLKRAMGLLGEEAKKDVQNKIRSGIEPANSELTIAMKRGSTKTLVDTGQLVQSITYEIRGLTE